MTKAIIFDFAGTLVNMRPPKLLIKRSLLQELSEKYILVIITGAKRTETNNILAKLKVESYFSHVITKDDSRFSKPDKRLFEEVKDKLSFEKCIYVGDSASDYRFSVN